MKRRKFIKSVGALAGSASIFYATGFASAVTSVATGPTAVQLMQIESSIKAGFGDGFQVISSEVTKDMTTSLIEHHGNIYLVSSVDLVKWDIVKSTEM